MQSIQWNIFLAEIGFIDNSTSKLRPVIVISEPVGEHNIVLVAPIYTAKFEHTLRGDIAIVGNYNDLGLVWPSTIRLDRISSHSISDLKELLGHATDEIQKAAIVELKKLLNV